VSRPTQPITDQNVTQTRRGADVIQPAKQGLGQGLRKVLDQEQ
jgi:hypothetical protein